MGRDPNTPAWVQHIAFRVRDMAALNAAKEQVEACGLDVVVIDHHTAEPTLPEAFAVVNPNRLDESSPHRTLAAVGVDVVTAIERAATPVIAAICSESAFTFDRVQLGSAVNVLPSGAMRTSVGVFKMPYFAEISHPGVSTAMGNVSFDSRAWAFLWERSAKR